MVIKLKKLEEMLQDARSKVEDIDPLSVIGKEDQYTIIDVREPAEVQETGMVLGAHNIPCLLYTSPSPRDNRVSRMPSSA